jgi:S-adenosylmethionine-diacylglycerol 3-amino-3-carboxypropyl transferase
MSLHQVILVLILAVFVWKGRTLFSIPFVVGTDDLSLSLKHLRGKRVLCITSGGCNPLSECLRRDAVYTCDMNPNQTFLLELKMAVIRTLPYASFWAMFGDGLHPRFTRDYTATLRPLLSPAARRFWDKRTFYFSFLGFHRMASLQVLFSTGFLSTMWPPAARVFTDERCLTVEDQARLLAQPSLRRCIALFASVHRMANMFPASTGVNSHQWTDANAAEVLWTGLQRRATIPNAFCHDYITQVYTHGKLTRGNCPDYMKESAYQALKANVHRIHLVSGSMLDAMRSGIDTIDIFYPLDHLDCVSLDEVRAEAHEMHALSRHRPVGTAIAVVKSVQPKPSYLSVLRSVFDVRDITADLAIDGSDIYMLSSAYLLVKRHA